MKRFFITTLLCVAALNAMTSKEGIVRSGFYENKSNQPTDIAYPTGTQEHPSHVIIDRNHLPANMILPRHTEVYFPRPIRSLIGNKTALNFETDGTFLHGYYLASEEGSQRIFWSLVEDESKQLHTVPTARLMIALNQEQLEATGYQENWSEDAQDKRVELIGGFCVVDKAHVPTHNVLPPETEIFFPLSQKDYLEDKNALDFTPTGFFAHGHYCAPEANSSRIYWSIVEDDYGKRYSVPSAHLMLHANTVYNIQLRRKSRI